MNKNSNKLDDFKDRIRAGFIEESVCSAKLRIASVQIVVDVFIAFCLLLENNLTMMNVSFVSCSVERFNPVNVLLFSSEVFNYEMLRRGIIDWFLIKDQLFLIAVVFVSKK